MMNSFNARSSLQVGRREFEIYRIDALKSVGIDVDRLPYSLKILLENLLRHEDGVTVTADDIRALAMWDPKSRSDKEISFMPARVLLQDFTGVPALVDLAAMRDAMAELGGDPQKINPLLPVELVIDHSIQVDVFGTADAFNRNEELDYKRNEERYKFIKWGNKAFRNFAATPPNAGICHQVNLEFLARVVFGGDDAARFNGGPPLAYPDTLIGTDSHTPMVNGLGVLGWGVGGIEAEAAMLGQPISMLIPQIVGFRLTGALREGTTATDLVLTVAEMLRKKGVVGQFVEFYGPGISSLSVADRATVGNMSPEYGSTCTIFPVDQTTLDYLRFTGRSEERIALVEAYMKEQGLFHTVNTPEPVFTDTLELDLDTVEASIAGPRRPQDRIPLGLAKNAFQSALTSLLPPRPSPKSQTGSATGREEHGHVVGTWGEGSYQDVPEMTEYKIGEEIHQLRHGSVVIAAITSCTNTSNPSVMIAAGLLARNAAQKGLRRKPWVKTSLAPGSRVVTDYYDKAGLTPHLETLGFYLAGYGCTTCIGNSGPLPAEVSEAIERHGLVVASVLSGNRNFEGRIHSEVRANFLMSPPLVVAFAIAGRIDINLYAEPLGHDSSGQPVFLRDIWPAPAEVERVIRESVSSEMFDRNYRKIHEGDGRWNVLEVKANERYSWETASTYLRKPPYFEGMPKEAPQSVAGISSARAIAVLGDSVTTDHISPAGSIKKDSPAGRFLIEHGVELKDFNSYGSRRGNHEVMVRGTFANVRIRNRLVPEMEGPFTRYLPTGEIMPIYDAAMRYQSDGTPLIVLAGKEYGSGSSRDWAAKGPQLQGIRAVIAQSYERIHRSNLIGMGILPLQFAPGESIESLALSGEEVFDIVGLTEAAQRGSLGGNTLKVHAKAADGRINEFEVWVRIDTPQELLYYRHGGILRYVLRQLLSGKERPDVLSPAMVATPPPEPGQKPSDGVVDEGSIASFPASDPPAY
ncbi:aconitate hydratase AcnA [Noviherbaspirillum sp.]|uniref:aconitate hydratase AcnA n=1 Tax=Noviherbaspirillum sp. TaxID=1926288 RepID=UPI002B48704C|nr:aconitate hydratase AcnA [Noviherbaspirillum sp.]HJV79885.1 aconitate hydratase AcnA [Noviherbaspirillum sp.]